jgi:SAM-dependent methyltransferase
MANSQKTDGAFVGSIPKLYDEYLVPLIFEPYAVEMTKRVVLRRPSQVLEIAAGTGVVTRHLANDLGPSASIVASDLNQPMLDQAAAAGTSRPVEWEQADAMSLPFEDGAFDVVVCQFGVMFFPDKAKAFSEARRLLRPGGTFIFNVWDRIDRNDFANTVTSALEQVFPDDPPRFMARIPHGYHDCLTIKQDLVAGGFTLPAEITTVTARSRANSPHIPATAFCQATPLRSEIEARDASKLKEATDVAAAEIAKRFGSGTVTGQIQAHIVIVER